MKFVKLFSCIFFILPGKSIIAQDVKNPFNGISFYLVRHAEKDTGNNPPLKETGYLRAGDLYRVLKNKKISKIYVSQYRRTELTADSVRIYGKVDTVHYKADAKGDDLFDKLSKLSGQKKTVLIVGHSNTIPDIIRRLAVKDFKMVEIPDNEFDNLYLVSIRNNKASLKIMKYGKTSLPAEKKAMTPLQ